MSSNHFQKWSPGAILDLLHDKLGKIECDITKSKCADLGDPISVYTIREYI